MSEIGEKIRQAIRGIIKSELKNSSVKASIACTVKSVSGDPLTGLMTCDCAPIDGSAIIDDVQLCADFNDATTKAGFLLIPSVDSIVTVSFKNNADAFVSMVSVVDSVFINGNDYGGLVNAKTLLVKLNTIEGALNALGVWALTVTPPLTLPPIVPTTSAEIENATINHGIGNLT